MRMKAKPKAQSKAKPSDKILAGLQNLAFQPVVTASNLKRLNKAVKDTLKTDKTSKGPDGKPNGTLSTFQGIFKKHENSKPPLEVKDPNPNQDKLNLQLAL